MLNVKLITKVADEPISLAEAKNHLRNESSSYSGNTDVNQSISPGSYPIDSGLEGTGIDISSGEAIVNLNVASCASGGSLNVKIQESDDNVTFTDWYEFSEVTEANDNAIYEKEYNGTKKYIRCYAVIAGNSCEFSCDIVINSGNSNEDPLIESFILAARQYGEDVTRHAFAPQTWDYFLNEFPSKDYIEWFKGPLTSITYVKYKDSSGNETILTEGTDYLVDVDVFPGKIFLPYNKSWPSYTPYPYNSITIRGICGYDGTEPNILHEIYKKAMLLHIGYMNKFRDVEIPKGCLDTIKSLYITNKINFF